MANFVDFEVGAESPTNDSGDEDSEYSDSLEYFIDDDDEDDALLSRSFSDKFENISVDETLEEQYKKSLVDIENLECSNFCETSEEEGEIDEFKDVTKRVEKFKETILLLSSENENENVNSLVNAILFAMRFDLEEKTNTCSLSDLRQELPIEDNLFFQLNKEKFSLTLNNQKFNAQCQKINAVLAVHGYFLRMLFFKNIFKNFLKIS